MTQEHEGFISSDGALFAEFISRTEAYRARRLRTFFGPTLLPTQDKSSDVHLYGYSSAFAYTHTHLRMGPPDTVVRSRYGFPLHRLSHQQFLVICRARVAAC